MRQLPSNNLKVLELFCGGGIGAVGFKLAGYEIVKAIDFDKNAISAYRNNLGDHAELSDINSIKISDLPDVDIIFGGPPCQDYSTAGNREGAEGVRGRLVFRYLDIIEEKRPKAFVFENVKGLITGKHRETFDALLTKFSNIGYEVSWKLINAWDYGVAQKRHRVFIVGIRKDVGTNFEFPMPQKEDYQTNKLEQALSNLPDANNDYLPLTKDELKIVKHISPGGNWKEVPYECLPVRLKHIKDNLKKYHSPAFYKRAKPDEPAGTVSATMNPTHCQALPPEGDRRFTVRECLRIQSVPDWYVFPDTLSLSAQYRIVGNGIASRVAWYIGKQLAEHLNHG
jgi:DNA (cytosine-5)-methyltransferase 1